MSTKRATKRALLTSILAICLCLVMLVGSTFAWFTDTASTAVNRIESGKLDVQLVDANGKELTSALKWKKAAGHENEAVLWEPGASYDLESFYIKNNGNLALKYKIVITGIIGDNDLMDAIDFTYKIGTAALDLSKEGRLAAGATSEVITINGKMKESAGNEYMDKTIDGIGITVYATQDTVEHDSFNNTYDEKAAYDESSNYAQGAYISGLTNDDGTAKTFADMTAAAKAWRESKGIVTSGNTFGANSLGGTVDEINWIISGSVKTGNGEGVVGNNGAGNSIFGGGYYTPSVTVNNITIKGVNGAKIVKSGDSYRVGAAAQNVVYEGITFADTVRIDSNPANITFKNCTFEAGLRMPHSAANANVTIENCTFTGNEESGYAIFVQGTMANVSVVGNNISDCQKGINIQAGADAVVTISGNTITNVLDSTKSAVQLTTAKTFVVSNNEIDVNAIAFRIYKNCAAEITFTDNTIKANTLLVRDTPDTVTIIATGNNTFNGAATSFN